MKPVIIELNRCKNGFETKIENYRRWLPLLFNALYIKIIENNQYNIDQLLMKINKLRQFKNVSIGIFIDEYQFCDEKDCANNYEYIDFLITIELNKKWYIDYALQMTLTFDKNVKIRGFVIDTNTKNSREIIESIIILLSFIFNKIRDKIDRYIHSY